MAGYYSLGLFEPFTYRSLNLPIFSSATDLATRVIGVNLAATATAITNTAYGETGEIIAITNAVNPAVFDLASQQFRIGPAEAVFGLGNNVDDGWIEMQVQQPAFFAWEQIENDADLDSLIVDDAVAFTLVLTEVTYDTNYPTRIHLINPSSSDARIDLSLHDRTGRLVVEPVQFLTAKGKLNATLADLFTNVPLSFTGYVILSGSQEIAASAILSSSTSLSVIKAQLLAKRTAGSILHLPGVALGPDQYAARLELVNPTNNSMALVLHARNAAGTEIASPAAIRLEPRQQRTVDLAAFFSRGTGDGTLLSFQIDGQTAHLLGHLTLSFGNSTNAPSCVQPLDIEATTDWVFGSLANDAAWSIDVSLLNPGGASAWVEVNAFSANGKPIGMRQVVLPAQGTLAQSLRSLIPASDGQASGYFTILSYQPIIATAMLGKTNRLGLSSLMGQPTGLAGLRPKLRVQLTPDQTVLRWPAAAFNFILESAPNLQQPATWTPVSNAPSLMGDDQMVTEPRSTTKFYRLRK